jgi:V/A-type H+-transporting ATPase subunit C
MLSNFSGNAIMAKARAMYGSHLTMEHYQEMMRKQRVSDIAAYLRDETQYREVLEEVAPGAVHRGQLEYLLKESRFLQYRELMRYNTVKGKRYFHYFIAEIEIEQILRMIRLLNMGAPEQYVLQYPRFVERYIRFPMDEMAKVKDFDGMLKVLEETPYARLLVKLRPQPGAPIRYTQCEIALFAYHYHETETIVNRYFRGRARAQLQAYFRTHVELINIRNMYRLKKYFPHTARDMIQASFISAWRRVPDTDMERLMAAEDMDAWITALYRSRYGSFFEPGDDGFIEYRLDCVRYRLAKRYLHFAGDAPVAFTAYMTLCEIELGNIISVIEGIRSQIAPEEIQKMLIL